jgi:hypothetical protein
MAISFRPKKFLSGEETETFPIEQNGYLPPKEGPILECIAMLHGSGCGSIWVLEWLR